MPGILSNTVTAVQMVVNRAPKNEPRGIHQPIAMQCPVTGQQMRDYAYANLAALRGPEELVAPDVFHGQVLALCAAGPSLRDALYPADQVWGCNSAAGVLRSRGLTAAVGIDQTTGLLKDWKDPAPVTHYVASTVDPMVVAHLRARGVSVKFFHNLVGWDETNEHADELRHYNEDWPPAFMVANGGTVVSRVLGLAAWMGFRRIDVYGADCSFGADDMAHANGESVVEAYGAPVIMQGEVGGRTWRARPDMLMCAVDLARRASESNGRIRLMGDTLPVALLGYDEAYLDSVMRRLEPGEVPKEASHG